MARIYREPTFNNQFKSFAESGKFVTEKSFNPSKQIRQKAKEEAQNLKSLARNQQRQAAVNQGYFNAEVAEGSAKLAKTKALLSFASSGINILGDLDKTLQAEKAKQEGLDFLKPELGGSIVEDEIPNTKLEDVAEFETDLTEQSANNVDAAKSVSGNNAVIEEEIISETANSEAARSSTQITTYTAASSLETDLEAFLRSDTKIRLSDGTIIVAKDATVDQLPIVIDVGLDHVTKSYFPHELSGKTLHDTYIPTAKRVYGSLLNKFNQEKIALAQETRVLEHVDLATVALDNGQPIQGVVDNLLPKLYSSGAYDSKADAFEAGFSHLSNYYRANQDIEGATALLNIFKVKNKDGTYNVGTKLADDPVYSIKVMDLVEKIRNDKKNIKNATISGFEKDMFSKLSGVNEPEKRREIVFESIKVLNEAGYHEEANKLAAQIDQLQISDIQKVEDANIYQQVVSGEITSKDVLDEQLKLSVISKSGYDKAIAELDDKNPVIPDGGAKTFTDDVMQGYLDRFKIRIGAEVNPFGEVLFATDAGYLDNASDRARINAALELDLKKVALTTYKLNKDQGTGTQIAEIDKALKNYFELQVTSEGGKYYVKPFANDNSVFVSDGTRKLKSLLNSPENLTRAFGDKNSSLKPVKFDFNASDKITLESIATYKSGRGDTIFKKDTHKVFVDEYVQNGSFNPTLIEAATAVGMTPLQFLNRQSTNHGLGQVYRPQTSLSTDKPNYVASTEFLLNKGVSNKAAKILTGNFDEGTWQEISSNNSFLNFDTEFKVEDLETILEKLKLDPKTYSVITNPYATDRQVLEVASEIFK
mgnify:CR=1 FL=1